MSHKHLDYGLMRPPGPRLLRSLALKFANRHAHGGKRSVYAELNLTSLVDMLTILVVFLVQLFSASGELYTISKDIKLPGSLNYSQVMALPVITISKQGVSLNGTTQATYEQLKQASDAAEPVIVPLRAALEAKKAVSSSTTTPADAAFSGRFLIMADKATLFQDLIPVMYTATKVGYSRPLFLVEQSYPAP